MNLLDNMDGLAAGVGLIAAGFLAACCCRTRLGSRSSCC